jgi:hypothetical protein
MALPYEHHHQFLDTYYVPSQSRDGFKPNDLGKELVSPFINYTAFIIVDILPSLGSQEASFLGSIISASSLTAVCQWFPCHFTSKGLSLHR